MSKRVITVFEHDILKAGQSETCLSIQELDILQRHCEVAEYPYYSLMHNGIKFCGYVGVIQVGKLTIEVLPKIDRGSKDQWRAILIDMLRKVGSIDVASTSETDLKLKRNSVLDLYIENFLSLTQELLHRGLLRRYRKVEANATALKGKLLFQKHIIHNLTHKERFYVRYTTFDSNHLLNSLLYKTLKLVARINTNKIITSLVNTILLDFPEMPDVVAKEETFEKIVFSRQNEHYRRALNISRLILLNYFPDINSGRNHVVAVMFDMNLLWEKFVYLSLKKYSMGAEVQPQESKPYWKLGTRRAVKLKPDVVISKSGIKYVLDTKWKLPSGNRPSHSDLQQMYAYTKYFDSDHTILCYPGKDEEFLDGHFHSEFGGSFDNYRCSVLRLKFRMEDYEGQNFIALWMRDIAERINRYCVPQT